MTSVTDLETTALRSLSDCLDDGCKCPTTEARAAVRELARRAERSHELRRLAESFHARAEAAEADRDRYREALEQIANTIVPHPYSPQFLKDIARAALDRHTATEPTGEHAYVGRQLEPCHRCGEKENHPFHSPDATPDTPPDA